VPRLRAFGLRQLAHGARCSRPIRCAPGRADPTIARSRTRNPARASAPLRGLAFGSPWPDRQTSPRAAAARLRLAPARAWRALFPADPLRARPSRSDHRQIAHAQPG
jgi:hypothetical protein